MSETLVNGYSSESTQRELSNEYQHDRVQVFFKNLCVLVLLTKVDSALEGLSTSLVLFYCDNAMVLPAACMLITLWNFPSLSKLVFGLFSLKGGRGAALMA